MSYNSNTVLSCADSRILYLYSLSKISSDGIFDGESNFVPSCIELLNIIFTNSDREQISVIQYCMSTSYSKVVVDHYGDLSSSWKPILFLGVLLLEADLLLELGILHDLVQTRGNLASHLEIWNILLRN